jgi:hypothetical protein
LNPSKKIKPRSRRFKKTGKSQKDDEYDYDNDPEDHIPSFEESSTFPIAHRDEHVSSPSSSNLKRARKGLDSFFVPRTTPSVQPTLDAKWKNKEKKASWKCIGRWWYDAD